MGIWKQRIEGSWLRCSGSNLFSISNLRGAPAPLMAVAISLKHKAIERGLAGGPSAPSSDQTNLGYRNMKYFGTLANGQWPSNSQILSSTLGGLMFDGIGQYGTLSGSQQEYSYIIDYYYDSITTTSKFLATKNYQFKTHVLNFAYINTSDPYESATSGVQGSPAFTIRQQNDNVYYSSMNIFKGALGINPTWEDEYTFEVPYYKSYNSTSNNTGVGNFEDGIYYTLSKRMPSTYILYYYSSPKENVDSGFVAYTNRLKRSTIEGSDSQGQTAF